MKTAIFIKGIENPILVKESYDCLNRRATAIGQFIIVTDQIGRITYAKDMTAFFTKNEKRMIEEEPKKAKKVKK